MPLTGDLESFLTRANRRIEGIPLNEMFGVEIFAGSGRLTCELRRVGLNDSVGVDSNVGRCLIAPILKLDLLDPESHKLLLEILNNPRCVYAHLAPPCGTASRARAIRHKGKCPAPCRSGEYPDGLPFLESILQARVNSANSLYALSGLIFKECWERGILCSIENPGRSFMWQTSHWLLRARQLKPLSTLFHHCMFGGSRAKLTRLIYCVPSFQQLGIFCCDESESHVHEPWGKLPSGKWATSEETAYLVDLCRARRCPS